MNTSTTVCSLVTVAQESTIHFQRRFTAIFGVILLGILFLNPLVGMDRAQLVQEVKQASVLIETPQGIGSGFVIDRSGLVVTNHHVVRELGANQHATIVVDAGLPSQRILSQARVVRTDPTRDLALLQVGSERPLPTLRLGNSDQITELMDLVAFGFPFGNALAGQGRYPTISVNRTSVSALRRDSDGALDRLQLDSNLNPGNSGGPVVNLQGQVVGIVVGGIPGAGINLAIPVKHLIGLLDEPVITFDPPSIDASAASRPVELSVGIVDITPGRTRQFTVLVEVDVPGQAVRELSLAHRQGRYVTTFRPVEVNQRGPDIYATATFSTGEVSFMLQDAGIRVGSRSIRLGDIEQINIGESEVTLHEGGVAKGPIRGLEALQVLIGTNSVRLNVAEASQLTLRKANVSETTYTLTVQAEGRQIFKEEYQAGGGPSSGPRQASGGGSLPNQFGPASSATGLEALLEGSFKRPQRGARAGTSLRVLSTAGDYIGQGQRYQYEGEAIRANLRDGLITIQVDGWHLEFSPGQGKIFQVGEYANASRYPFNRESPGLNFSGKGRGSNRLAGHFVIWELERQGGQITALAIDFIQRSEVTGPPLVGRLRVNSRMEP